MIGHIKQMLEKKIEHPYDINDLMKPYEDRISTALKNSFTIKNYSYPWNRKFEIEINF